MCGSGEAGGSGGSGGRGAVWRGAGGLDVLGGSDMWVGRTKAKSGGRAWRAGGVGAHRTRGCACWPGRWGDRTEGRVGWSEGRGDGMCHEEGHPLDLRTLAHLHHNTQGRLSLDMFGRKSHLLEGSIWLAFAIFVCLPALALYHQQRHSSLRAMDCCDDLEAPRSIDHNLYVRECWVFGSGRGC